MGVGDEPMIGRSGDASREASEILVVEVDMLGVAGGEGASFTDIREGGEIRSDGGG